MMLRALESPERAHTLLTGPSACAKSLFMLQIEKLMSSKVYFAEGASTTKVGLQKFISENQDKEIIISKGVRLFCLFSFFLILSLASLYPYDICSVLENETCSSESG
jgi:hypothetical protein